MSNKFDDYFKGNGVALYTVKLGSKAKLVSGDQQNRKVTGQANIPDTALPGYCRVVGLKQVWKIDKAQSLGHKGSKQQTQLVEPCKFSIEVTCVTTQQKSEMVNALKTLQLSPVGNNFPEWYSVEHPMLKEADILRTVIESVDHPEWNIKPMTWKLSCSEFREPQSVPAGRPKSNKDDPNGKPEETPKPSAFSQGQSDASNAVHAAAANSPTLSQAASRVHPFTVIKPLTD